MSNLPTCSQFLCSTERFEALQVLMFSLFMYHVYLVRTVLKHTVWSVWVFCFSAVSLGFCFYPLCILSTLFMWPMILCRLKRTLTKKEKDKIAKRQAKAKARALARGEKAKCFYWTGWSNVGDVLVHVRKSDKIQGSRLHLVLLSVLPPPAGQTIKEELPVDGTSLRQQGTLRVSVQSCSKSGTRNTNVCAKTVMIRAKTMSWWLRILIRSLWMLRMLRMLQVLRMMMALKLFWALRNIADPCQPEKMMQLDHVPPRMPMWLPCSPLFCLFAMPAQVVNDHFPCLSLVMFVHLVPGRLTHLKNLQSVTATGHFLICLVCLRTLLGHVTVLEREMQAKYEQAKQAKCLLISQSILHCPEFLLGDLSLFDPQDRLIRCNPQDRLIRCKNWKLRFACANDVDGCGG